jgi:hypothetical protein
LIKKLSSFTDPAASSLQVSAAAGMEGCADSMDCGEGGGLEGEPTKGYKGRFCGRLFLKVRAGHLDGQPATLAAVVSGILKPNVTLVSLLCQTCARLSRNHLLSVPGAIQEPTVAAGGPPNAISAASVVLSWKRLCLARA